MENGIQVGSWINVKTIGGPHMDTPEGRYPNVRMHYLPKLCSHCMQPACLTSCHTHAIYKRKDGIVLIDKDKCNGCRMCTEACPYEAIKFNPETSTVEKCTLCSHRIDRGLNPFCVKCCPTRAMEFGDIKDPDSKIFRSIRKKRAQVISPECRTQPSVYYSPQ